MAKEKTTQEAAQALQQREQELTEAKATLDAYERNIGQHALDVGVDKATQEVLRLQIAVKAAETAVEAAQLAVKQGNRRDQAARVVQLRAEADKLDEEVAALVEFLNEWEPKVQQARQQTESKAMQSGLHP